MQDSDFKSNWDISLNNKIPNIEWPVFKPGDNIATRKVWGAVIEAMASKMRTLVGGSADLEPSNVTVGFADIVKDFTKDNPELFIIDEEETFDIDYPWQFEMANVKYKYITQMN